MYANEPNPSSPHPLTYIYMYMHAPTPSFPPPFNHPPTPSFNPPVNNLLTSSSRSCATSQRGDSGSQSMATIRMTENRPLPP